MLCHQLTYSHFCAEEGVDYDYVNCDRLVTQLLKLWMKSAQQPNDVLHHLASRAIRSSTRAPNFDSETAERLES